jgi:putative transposase
MFLDYAPGFLSRPWPAEPLGVAQPATRRRQAAMTYRMFRSAPGDRRRAVSPGQNIVDAIRQIGVSEVTYYRWRQEFGGLKIEQVKRLKDLELENGRLRKAVSDLTLDKLILQEAARGNF